MIEDQQLTIPYSGTHETEDYTLRFQNDTATQARAFGVLLAWFIKHELFHGESIHQTDTTYVEAPHLLTELAEKVFKFKSKYK